MAPYGFYKIFAFRENIFENFRISLKHFRIFGKFSLFPFLRKQILISLRFRLIYFREKLRNATEIFAFFRSLETLNPR